MTSDRAHTLMAVGDVLIRRRDPVSIFGGGIRELLQGADILVGNQEGPVSDRGRPFTGKAAVGSPCIRASLASLDVEADLGFTAMTLANNHMMDYGPDALFQTLEVLHEHGISATGAGSSLAQARRPSVSTVGGTRIAMLGYTSVFPPFDYAASEQTPGVASIRVDTSYQTPRSVPYQPGTPATTVTVPNSADVDAMVADIRAAQAIADLVVVQFHWGVTGLSYPLGYMKELGRRAIDEGADLVLGNHPHLLMGVEIYRAVPIIYNLNHFALDGRPPLYPGALDALILKSEIHDGRFTRHAIVLAAVDDQSRNVSLADPDGRADAASRLHSLSAEFGTIFDVEGDELVIGGPADGTPPPLRAPQVYFDAPPFVQQALAVADAMSRGKGARFEG
jgi:poly-gamma-glutamate capsule biosynthesis protein CapA/YwtB (metallophosphatase superfamily)